MKLLGRIFEIKVNYGLTINTGNYNSLRIDLEARVTVDPSERPNEVYDQIYAELKTKAQELTGH